MMKKTKVTQKYFLFFLVLLLVIGCSRVKSDARKAAKLTNKSIEKMNQLKMDDAEKLFLKSQAIIEKYESHKKSEKFSALYQQERDKNRKGESDLQQ